MFGQLEGIQMHPNASASTDLRQVHIDPNFWYPVTRSSDVKSGGLFAAQFAGCSSFSAFLPSAASQPTALRLQSSRESV
jgi:hypothetical protein